MSTSRNHVVSRDDGRIHKLVRIAGDVFLIHLSHPSLVTLCGWVDERHEVIEAGRVSCQNCLNVLAFARATPRRLLPRSKRA